MTESALAPISWTIAGADPSGGAGIQADLRAFAGFRVHAGSVITAVTAQALSSYSSEFPVPAATVSAQIHSLIEIGLPTSVKIGMLGSVETATAVADFVADYPGLVVLDPVLGASAGHALADQATKGVIVERLMRRADLVTPNAREAERLTGCRIVRPEDMPEAASALRAQGATRVLLKGGHVAGQLVHDYYVDDQQAFWLTSPRLSAAARGTGCTLSAAIAAGLARGWDIADAVVAARAYLHSSLRAAWHVQDSDPAVLPGMSWPAATDDFPWASPTLDGARERPTFASCGPAPLGFYPIVDRAVWIERLARLGVSTLQLRIKDISGVALDDEIRRGIAIARDHGVRLFINDYWKLALEHGAYGIHLGQEDLDALATSDLRTMQDGGIRLGISTHSYLEAAKAHALRPSYVALGPIYPTTCKSMRFGPQGLGRIAEWRALLPYPLVAIGGLKLEHAKSLYSAGADGIAVISDVAQAADPEARVRSWLASGTPRPKQI